jgi:hypothetical protein
MYEGLPYRDQIVWPGTWPTLFRWSRMLMCLLFALVTVIHVTHNSSTGPLARGVATVEAVAGIVGKAGIPDDSKAIMHCDYNGGCPSVLPLTGSQDIVFPKATILAPATADGALVGDILGPPFRPPRLHNQI